MSFLNRLHAKMGDFWWYSLMIFCASRAADVLNMFVGLWLVPKYVPPEELGAVQPLVSFAGFLAIPAGVFASTFRQELTNMSIRRDFGRMKTLMRGVFIATAVFFFVALVAAKLVLPMYVERIRVLEGSLGIVILASSFAGTASAIYSNPLQALKKFKAMSAIHILGAPIRFMTMIVTMPFRALTGYFVGQTATPMFSIVASVVALRKELAVPAEPYWNMETVRRFGRLFMIFGVGAATAGLASLVETTVLRQRLPEIDSAAYYVVTRFSDIAGFLMNAFVFAIFPFTAEISSRGKSTNALVIKVGAVLVATNAALLLFFWLFGRQAIGLVPGGERYLSYDWAIPCMIAIVTLGFCSSLYFTAEASANRFGYMRFFVPLHILYPVALLFVTGYGYFSPYLPHALGEIVEMCSVRSLPDMMKWMTLFAVIRLACCIVHANMSRRSRSLAPRACVLV